MARATFRDGIEKIPLYIEDAAYLFSEATLHIFKFLVDMAIRCNIMEIHVDTFGVSKAMDEELIGALNTRGEDDELRDFVIRLFVEMARARLLLARRENPEYAHILGMLSFSIWRGKGYLDKLEGLSGRNRTDVLGVTHPRRRVRNRESYKRRA